METRVYICPRCKYETDRISNIKAHLQRKIPCRDVFGCGKTCDQVFDEIGEDSLNVSSDFYKCDGCNAVFKSSQGKAKHIISCKDYEILKLKEENNKLKEENNDLKNEIKRIKQEPSTSHISIVDNSVTNNNNIGNSVTNNNHNITIVVNDFGNEDITHVLTDTEFLDKCLKDLSNSGIEKIVEKIYYDEDHPENTNVLMKSVKQGHIMMKTNGSWKRMSVTTPATKMVYKGKNILESYYVDSGKQQAEFKKLVEEGDSYPEDRKTLYLQKLSSSTTNEHRSAVSKVKGVISNYKYKPRSVS